MWLPLFLTVFCSLRFRDFFVVFGRPGHLASVFRRLVLPEVFVFRRFGRPEVFGLLLQILYRQILGRCLWQSIFGEAGLSLWLFPFSLLPGSVPGRWC
jgi:hypothetical protein